MTGFIERLLVDNRGDMARSIQPTNEKQASRNKLSRLRNQLVILQLAASTMKISTRASEIFDR